MIRTPTFRHVPALFAAMCAGLGVLCPAPTAAAQAEPAPVQPASAQPAAAPEGNPATPARSVLWPDFQVGQRAVLEMSYLDSSKSAKSILATITVEVIDKTDDVFTIRWTPSDTLVPRDFNAGMTRWFHCIMNGTAGPPLEIQIQEDAGYVGIRNWREASDKALTDIRDSLLRIGSGTGNALSGAQVDETIAPLRDTVFGSQEAAESTLFKNANAYFEGSYHEITPGQTVVTQLEVPWPFGDAEAGLVLPMTRTLSLATIATEPTPVYELSIHQEHDAERMKALLKSFAENLPEEMRSEEVRRITNSNIETKTRWRFDAAKGWPTRVSSTTRFDNAGQVVTHSVSYTLIDGPTMKVADEPAEAPKTEAAPTQLDTP